MIRIFPFHQFSIRATYFFVKTSRFLTFSTLSETPSSHHPTLSDQATTSLTPRERLAMHLSFFLILTIGLSTCFYFLPLLAIDTIFPWVYFERFRSVFDFFSLVLPYGFFGIFSQEVSSKLYKMPVHFDVEHSMSFSYLEQEYCNNFLKTYIAVEAGRWSRSSIYGIILYLGFETAVGLVID